MDDATELKLFSKSTFASPVNGGNLVCCPTIDMAASAGDGNILYVWRANGQVVSKHNERNQSVQAMTWKDDGWSRDPDTRGDWR
jgi:hypothetical protein